MRNIRAELRHKLKISDRQESALVETQLVKFQAIFGRSPKITEILFFSPRNLVCPMAMSIDDIEELKEMLVIELRIKGQSEEIIHAFRKTGILSHSLDQPLEAQELEAWYSSIAEYRAMSDSDRNHFERLRKKRKPQIIWQAKPKSIEKDKV